jgi:hypothetical protein
LLSEAARGVRVKFAADYRVVEPMESEIIQLNVQRAGMEKISLRAELIGTSDAYRLVIAWPVGSEERRFDGFDYYECLPRLSRCYHIEPEGFGVLRQGARQNVYPSEMASQMGGAVKSYVRALGQPAFTKDLVGTF